MKYLLPTILAAFVSLAFTASAELEGKDFFAKDTRIIGANLLVDTGADNGGDTGVGVEGLFATSWFEMDEVGLLVGHRDNDDVEAAHVMFYISEQYDLTRLLDGTIGTPGYLFAYASAGAGYMWTSINEGSDPDSVILRLEGGFKLYPVQHIGLVLGIRNDWSDEPVFLDENGSIEDKNWEMLAGIRFHY